MSRTFKDEKKKKNKLLKEPNFKSRYSEFKIHGFESDFENSICPDCGGVCEYRNGFFNCCECNWGEFSNEYEISPNKELELLRVS
ncbi:MAG: hypothetical protein KDD45_05450 [Bdellovibrionales bacterium]|nr:hypothetical protein [Bdellovibrionales bacterium]